MGLSLRDLAERSGVSAPMLSQVERGETSPTLAIAERIAAGLDLTLSQLLRLDERGHVVVTRAARAARPRPRRSPHRGADAAAARPAGGRLAARARAGAPRPGARATRRCTSRERARPPSCSPGRPALMIDDERHDLEPGDSVTFDADLPHHFINDGDGAGRVPGRGRRRTAKELNADAEHDVRQDLGRARGRRRADLHRPAPRPRGHLAAGLRRPADRGPQGAPPRQDGRDRRSQRAHRRHRRRRG